MAWEKFEKFNQLQTRVSAIRLPDWGSGYPADEGWGQQMK